MKIGTKSLPQLVALALKGKCVFHPRCWKRVPAAFVINMQGIVIHRAIANGLYEYKKEETTE